MSCTLNTYNVGDSVWVIVNKGYFRAQITEILKSDEEDSDKSAVLYLVTGIKDEPTKYGVIGDALVSLDDISDDESVIAKRTEAKKIEAAKDYERVKAASKQLAEIQARRFISFMQNRGSSWSSVSDVEDAIVEAITSGFLKISYRKIQETGLLW